MTSSRLTGRLTLHHTLENARVHVGRNLEWLAPYYAKPSSKPGRIQMHHAWNTRSRVARRLTTDDRSPMSATLAIPLYPSGPQPACVESDTEGLGLPAAETLVLRFVRERIWWQRIA